MHRLRDGAAVLTAAITVFLGGSVSVVASSCAGLAGCGEGCCKCCSTGQACGDTCISRSYTCHVGGGCACDADGAGRPLRDAGNALHRGSIAYG
jgi:hypothetical protein